MKTLGKKYTLKLQSNRRIPLFKLERNSMRSFRQEGPADSTKLLPCVIVGPAELGMMGQRDEYVAIDKLLIAADLYLQIVLDYLVS
jgi:hypothetical protein